VSPGSYNITVGTGLAVTTSLADGSATTVGADGRVLYRRDVGLAVHDVCVVFGP
jgi:hypothetical protein